MAKKEPKGKKQEFLKFYASLRREAAIKECTLLNNHNECDGKIVNAHSIQRGKILQSISKNGQVFELAFEIAEEEKPTIQFKEVGIKKFSTFSGFCQKHDKTIFQPIEDQAFTNSSEQKMIYSYRAITKELHTKKESRRLNSIYAKDPIKSIQLIQDINDLKRLSDFIYSKLVSEEFDDVIHYSFVLNEFYPIACNSIFIPYFDMEGNEVFNSHEYMRIQKTSLPVEDSPFIILNIFPEGGNTYVLVSHVVSRINDFRFLRSIFDMPIDKFTDAISQLMLTYCENVGFNPDYVNTKFSSQEKQKIQEFFMNTMLDKVSYHKNNVNLFRN